ncbi:hypothetical protein PN36_14550 [Candidatus Thiomargarita nelsonii]|uniref:Uncharacterized protein n=1 Tax=Candidatus Thiomargarita nelsonii TaxID=1003181 RepID=A0A4E0R3M2_9GAMM|nr:hypothetical protein PN36_14550 [Candidatus Thiomargarita nelsonii]
MTEETPYPHVGEIVHFIVHAFGLFGRGDDLRKRLSRFAKEKDFNIAKANTLIDNALLKPLRKIDNDDESIRRLLQRWKQGNGLPEISSLLKFKHLNSLVSWLLLAKAWQHTTQVFAKTFGDKELFIRLVHNLYQKKHEGFDPDCVRVRVEPLDKHFFNNCLAPVFEISLDEEKTVGDEIRAALKNFEQNELSPYFRYFYEEGWGDYYALCADYEQALNFNFSRFLGVIDLLIEAGADVNKRQSDVSGDHSFSSFTPFLLSAKLGNIEIFRRLAGGNLTDCTDLDFTIITLALHLHKFELVTYILENCDQDNLRSIVNIQDKLEGNTAVHWALRAFFIERKLEPKFERILEKLLILAPDLSLKNKEGLTAAEMAARCGLSSIALELYRREVTHEKCSTTPTSKISSAH